MSESTKLIAYGEWVVITRKAVPEKTESGIHIPENARSKMEPEYIGTIVHIGSEALSGLSIGDRIVYSHNFPMADKNSKEVVYCFVHKRNILGKVLDSSLVVSGKPGVEGLRTPDRE